METVLGQFCLDFESRLRPLVAPVEEFLESAQGLPVDASIHEVLADTRQGLGQLSSLLTKVAEQRAYVIIFGPLKSGKSTLMNALSCAYVSEVTTLPAYPCMVYVNHGEEKSIRVTSHSGRTEVVADLASTRDRMVEAHGELARKVREVESRGEAFDPSVHLPDALRKIEVQMPSQPLARSGSVLVDTPGLYSRMKFGYDLMTREFRNAAASAIFVVKTDNLFLEQVFDEFSDLMRLFSRIFLVVNLDGTKQDLQPDGKLGPSLERRDPAQILEAFETLAMSTDLKEAWEQERLKIYPIDLLAAASRRLQQVDGERVERAKDPGDAGEATLDAFDTFVGDLTRYLDGTESLTAFLSDSLRQADHLVGDFRRRCDSSAARSLEVDLAQWQARADLDRTRLEATQRLEALAWEERFARRRDEVVAATRAGASGIRQKTALAAEAALSRWFDSDASYEFLLHHEMRGVLETARDEIIALASDSSVALLSGALRGAEFSDKDPASVSVLDDLDRLGVRIDELVKEVEGTVQSSAEGHGVDCDVPARLIAVTRTLWDWFWLRGSAAVRQSVLGPDDKPSRPISPSEKQSRLGIARVALSEAIRQRIDAFFAGTLGSVAAEVFGGHVAAVSARIRQRLPAWRAEHSGRLEISESQHANLAGAQGKLTQLLSSLDSTAGAIDGLAAAYGEGERARRKGLGEGGSGAMSERGRPPLLARAAAAGAGWSEGEND